MLAISFIHWFRCVGFVGRDGVGTVLVRCRASMSGWLCSCVNGYWHAVLMALRTLWCIYSCFFQAFCCVLGRKPPWLLALWDRGGAGLVIHVCSIHLLRESVIFLNWLCVVFHCVCVSCSFCSVLMRLAMSRVCDSMKDV